MSFVQEARAVRLSVRRLEMTSTAGSLARSYVLAILVAAAGGCGDPVPTAAQPCPCASGYICCDSGVCAQDQASCGAATAALSAQAQGHWVGYIEGATFPSGSDALDLTFQAEADGTLSGTVKMGMGPPPPPATDGSVAWQPAEQWILEGFAYHPRNIVWQARRLRFDIPASEPWQPWCALQKSYSWGDNGWSCLPFSPSISGNGTNECEVPGLPNKVDCSLVDACYAKKDYTCTCNADGCSASNVPGEHFDIALRGDSGDGSMGQITVRLMKQ
jgi:hypothetical protein